MTKRAPEGAAVDFPCSGTPESQVARARDALVLEIAADMSAGRWVDGSTDALAAREGVSRKTVQHWSAAAARMLRLADQPAMKALHARNVERLNEVYDDASVDRDHKARVSAIAEQNKLCGLIVQKVDVTGHAVSAADYERFRTAVLESLCGDCRERLTKKLEEA